MKIFPSKEEIGIGILITILVHVTLELTPIGSLLRLQSTGMPLTSHIAFVILIGYNTALIYRFISNHIDSKTHQEIVDKEL